MKTVGMIALKVAPFSAVLRCWRLTAAAGSRQAVCPQPESDGADDAAVLPGRALWLQSLHALVWVVAWLSPVWILYVRLYEERDLEVQFGTPHRESKAKTPFFL